MAKTVDIRTKNSLARLVSEVEKNGEVVITRAGKPVAKLVAVNAEKKPSKPKSDRTPGFMKGQIWIGPDFDDPLPDDILKAFLGGGD